MATDDETDRGKRGENVDASSGPDVSRRNFLLGRIRPDPREQAEKAWRGSAVRDTANDPDAPSRPMPSVISWLEDSLDDPNGASGASGRTAPARSRANYDANHDANHAFPLLRPPGALAEIEFLEACTRCGDCTQACEPGAIRQAPPRLRSAAETPIIDPTLAPCLLCEDFPCISACEPGALRAEAPSSLGTAHVQAFDCLNRLGTTCSVCVERCPVPGVMSWAEGVPAVDASLCTGCGQCHYACPAPSNAIAIHPNAERPTRAEIEARAATEHEADDTQFELPELHDEVIDDEVVAELFRDLGALTRVLEIQEKGAAKGHAERLEPNLEDARARYVAGEIRALQILYVYEDETWCDTLMRVPEGTRVLRMKAPARATGNA